MNINQYMCNMRVLIGLFLANSNDLVAFNYVYEYVSPQIILGLTLYLGDRSIEGGIMKSFDVVFDQDRQFGVYSMVVRLL